MDLGLAKTMQSAVYRGHKQPTLAAQDAVAGTGGDQTPLLHWTALQPVLRDSRCFCHLACKIIPAGLPLIRQVPNPAFG